MLLICGRLRQVVDTKRAPKKRGQCDCFRQSAWEGRTFVHPRDNCGFLVPAGGTVVTMSRILVVDDNSAVRDVLKTLLLRAGFDVQVASSGTEAIGLLKGATLDLALVDIEMPGLTGYDLCTYMKTHPRFSRTPVLLMTGRSMAGVLEKGSAVGASEVLSKPFETAALLATLRKYLDASGEVR